MFGGYAFGGGYFGEGSGVLNVAVLPLFASGEAFAAAFADGSALPAARSRRGFHAGAGARGRASSAVASSGEAVPGAAATGDEERSV